MSLIFSLYRKAYAGLSPSTWLLAVVLLINRSGAMAIPFMTVYLTQQLHFTVQQAGIVMACFGVGAICGSFIGGKLSDKIGFYPVQFWSLMLQGLIFLVLGQMRTLPQFCVCIFVLSCVGDTFRPANVAATAYYSTPENRTRSYSLNRLASNLGWSVGPALGGILAGYSYHLLFWVDGLSCIVAITMMRFLLPPVKIKPKEKPAPDCKVTEPGVPSVYKDWVYLAFISLITVFTTGFLQLSTMVPLYLKSVVHMEEAHIGMLMGLNGLLVAFIEMVLVYKLEGRMHNLQFITRGVVLAGLGYLSFNILPPVAAAGLIFILLFTIGEMLSIPFMNSFFAHRSSEHNRGQYAGLYTMAFSISSVSAPTLGAYMVGHMGFSAWWYCTAALCISTGAGFYFLYKKVIANSRVETLKSVQSPG
ncbi:MFS transporter [Chitinophaga sp. S165]|uniref:MDR family MFS transporter n=1 Tax=Chitinophaga sp. S165 TaxID=2135462 RepID=UPI000D70E6CA|nr:MFS transporter [Chitinophaga sp. S165]PWV51836.1 putative MFS family arabinose efflux permease [Chitinophaga sp. S165]